MSNLIHIADRVLNRPLMILPDKLALIAQILEGRIGIDAAGLGENIDMSALQGPDASRFVGSSLTADGRSSKPYRVEKGTAIIQVLGSLVNRGAWIGAKSGMTSYEGLAFQLDQAKADGDVERVIIDLDSPGGEAVGAFEAGDKVAALAKVKEVVAVVNGMAASAAYAIAAQATKIVTTPSGISGSIGVVMMHADYSQAMVQKGIKPTLIFAGAHKVDGHPYGPLPDSVKADLVAEIDQFYSLFVSSVAKGRKGRLTEKSVRGTEARTFIGQAAVDAGVADAVGSFETALADLQRGSARNPSSKRANMEKIFSQVELDTAVTAAVTAARTEFAATATAAATQATAAINAARVEGQTAERERFKAILGSEEAKGREATALHFAQNSDMSADAAKVALAGVPKASAVAPAASPTGLFIEPAAAGAAAKSNFGWNDVVAEQNAQLAKMRA
jgi:capsid assembly protease